MNTQPYYSYFTQLQPHSHTATATQPHSYSHTATQLQPHSHWMVLIPTNQCLPTQRNKDTER